MSSIQGSSKQLFNGFATVLLGLLLRSLGEPTAHLGGLGDEVNQKLFRQVVPPALLARTRLTPSFYFLTLRHFQLHAATPPHPLVSRLWVHAARFRGQGARDSKGLPGDTALGERQHTWIGDVSILVPTNAQQAKPGRIEAVLMGSHFIFLNALT